MTPERIERKAIIISIAGSAAFGLLGIFISLISHSGAVFLDGLFSLIGAAAGLLTLYVSRLVQRPRDDQYPFGYAIFEPMLNLFKGLLIAFALLYAIWTAANTLITGGQEVSAAGGMIYSGMAVIGGIAVVLVLRRFYTQSKSPIVQVDAQNWGVDTMISGAVGLAFIAAFFIERSQWSDLAPYADPVIMLAIAAIAAPQPVQIVRKNWNQLMGRAPAREAQERVGHIVESKLSDVPHYETHIRMTEAGHYLYVHVYIIVPDDTDQTSDVKLHDRIRRQIYDGLILEHPYIAIDIGFTMDVRWALSSTPSEEHETVYIIENGEPKIT